MRASLHCFMRLSNPSSLDTARPVLDKKLEQAGKNIDNSGNSKMLPRMVSELEFNQKYAEAEGLAESPGKN